ncbi:GIY-YIG nuclease family protein [Candidatus Bathyarchaeota archaeon]|nr:GIY-YIG nuclease family protein [Candidatus Bathyarchaeota archaeon]
MLLCDDGSYYTGYTSNVTSRVHQHERGRGARYTKMRKPRKVVHVEKFRSRRTAMKRERLIKSLSHEQKQNLARRSGGMGTKKAATNYRRKRPFLVT